MIFPNYVYVLAPILFIYFIINALGNAAFPLIMSFILAFLSFPLVIRMEKKGIPRKRATVFNFSIIFIILILGLYLILPKIYQEASLFIKDFPEHIKIVATKIEDFLMAKGIEAPMDKAQLIEHVRKLTAKLEMQTIGKFSEILAHSFSGIVEFFAGIINLFLFPIFFYYIIVNYEKLSGNVKGLVPPRLKGSFSSYFTQINNIFEGFFRGQFAICFIQAIYYGLGLHFAGLKHGLIIGMVTGLLCFIPLVGFSMGVIIALIVEFSNFTGWGTMIGMVVVFTIGQTVESLFLTPKLVGGKVGLRPLSALISLLVGGSVGGLLGMFLAIPAGAIVVLTIKKLVISYKGSRLYLKK